MCLVFGTTYRIYIHSRHFCSAIYVPEGEALTHKKRVRTIGAVSYLNVWRFIENDFAVWGLNSFLIALASDTGPLQRIKWNKFT